MGWNWYIYSNTWVHGNLWQPNVKVIHWPLSKVTQSQHFQTCFLQTPVCRLKLNFIWSLHGKLGWKFVQCSGSHDQDGFQTHTWLKPSKISFFSTKRPITLKLGIHHRVLPKLCSWCHWVDLDHFYHIWSNLFPNASACVKAHTPYSNVFPSLFQFSISYALRWVIHGYWSSGFSWYFISLPRSLCLPWNIPLVKSEACSTWSDWLHFRNNFTIKVFARLNIFLKSIIMFCVKFGRLFFEVRLILCGY